MNHFSIRDIENLTQIKAHTLRIWEQRYQLINPKRKASQHRYYDNEDLKYILRISYLYHHGYKISYIASLNEQEIKKLALEIHPGADNNAIFINQLLEASIDFDNAAFERILDNAIHHAGFENCITGVVFPMLTKMGILWLTGNVIPAQEHFASGLITKELLYRIGELKQIHPRTDKKVLLFTPVGESHEIPLLFMHYVLKKNNIPVIYLGTNVCLDVLQTICRQQCVTHLYFHLITCLTRCDINGYVHKMASLFPGNTIVFSGSMIDEVQQVPSNVQPLRTSNDIQLFVK